MKTIEDRIDHWLNDYPLVEVDEHSLLREAAEELRRLRQRLEFQQEAYLQTAEELSIVKRERDAFEEELAR